MIRLMKDQKFFGMKYRGRTYDTGSKIGFLMANGPMRWNVTISGRPSGRSWKPSCATAELSPVLAGVARRTASC